MQVLARLSQPPLDLNFPPECVSICRMETRGVLCGRVLITFVFFAVFINVGCTIAELTPASDSDPSVAAVAESININTASQPELTRIPFIGERLAANIVEHRERFGPFRRAEELMLLNGVSDRRFREIRHLVRVN